MKPKIILAAVVAAPLALPNPSLAASCSPTVCPNSGTTTNLLLSLRADAVCILQFLAYIIILFYLLKNKLRSAARK